MDAHQIYSQATIKTAGNLRTIAYSLAAEGLSRLTLPEVDAAIDLVAQVVPAGNVPGIILSGLARLSGRAPSNDVIKRDIDMLFKGVEQVLDRAVYGAFFAGPAAVIWGYQNLLQLAGRDPDDAFPEGTWQFYVDYALREDTARHANETHGFDTLVKQHGLQLSRVDRITAWAMAAIHCLHQYDALLANEWRERVHIHLLREIAGPRSDALDFTRLYGEWEKRRPYGRGRDASTHEIYPAYRRRKYDEFLEEKLAELHPEQRDQWQARCRAAEEQSLPAYCSQLSILGFLKPGPNGETRTPIPIEKAQLGIILDGRYHLLPICAPGTQQPSDVSTVREQVAALTMPSPNPSPTELTHLAEIRRASLAALWTKLPPATIKQLEHLFHVPILLNFDQRPRSLPLSVLRKTERGFGSHALTIFDTGETFVFDQSHILFDGAWGAALAEILTNEALAWGVYLNILLPARPAHERPVVLAISFEPSDLDLIQRAPRVTPESSAETDGVDLPPILALRKLFKQRSDLLGLTVNDLLVLYRAIHAAVYEPRVELVTELESLARNDATRQAALAARDAVDASRQTNPAILIPIDASQRSPRDRLYPMTLEVPLADLDLLNLHRQTVDALTAYKQGAGERSQSYKQFDRLQRAYLATLAGFGAFMSKAKEIASAGESASVGTIKLLAYMPTPLQRLLDQIPGRFDVLNDIIKGREVFSNVGAVAPRSTLTRFISAKDDNEKKTLIWGILTDAQGIMRISLRDFRPHVGLLEAVGHKDTARRMTQDYLDAYAHGLNDYVHELRHVAVTSRETQLFKPETE